VLTGKKATCYPGFENRLTDSTFVEDRVVVEGNVITSRGPGTAAEFAEAIVRYLIGNEAARDLHERTLQK
jgi:4-methyl-5(b-hydroxyethyl)-thiazole monophosphate biosynthesis